MCLFVVLATVAVFVAAVACLLCLVLENVEYLLYVCIYTHTYILGCVCIYVYNSYV